MRYRALRPLRGDYGNVKAGDEFEVENHLLRRIEHLELKGLVERVITRPRIFAKVMRTFDNKSIQAAATK